MKRLKSLSFVAFVLLCAAVVFAGCVPKPEAEVKRTEPAQGGILKFGLEADPPTLDPHVWVGVADNSVKDPVYSGLCKYDTDGKVVPDLAESWENPEPLTYVFKLKPSVKFHNGDPCTAEDVKFSFDRIMDPKTGATRRSDFAACLKAVEVVDPLTVKFTLKEPNAVFLDLLANPCSAIVSKKFVEAGHDLKYEMMGTGPFMFKSREPGVSIELVKNPNYFVKGYPLLDGIKYYVLKDEDARVNALRTGNVDMIIYVPWKHWDTLAQDKSVKLYSGFGPFMMLMMNTSRPPLNDPRVRRAIALAIRKEDIVNIVFQGHAKPMKVGIIPEEHWAYNKELEQFTAYDPEKAKSLLKEAGYPAGLTFRIASSNQHAMHYQTAEVIQGNLKQIGIEAILDLRDWATIVRMRAKGDYEAMIMGTSAHWQDPDVYATYFLSSAAYYAKPTNFSDPEIDRLLAEGRQTLEKDRRKGIYEQVERKLLDQAPWVFLVWREEADASTTKVQGYERLPGSLGFFSAVNLERVWLEK